MLFKWIKSLFLPSKEDLKVLDRLFEEWDVRISPRGGLSKTSKIKKHRKAAFPEIRTEIKKNGFCKIKG